MIYKVIVDISTADVDRTFDYEGEKMPLGSRVSVEFGKKRLIGFVVGEAETSEFDNLKTAKLIDSPINPDQLKLMDFMRERYNLRYIDVLRLFIPSKLREERNPEYTHIYLKPNVLFSKDEAIAQIGARAKKQTQLYNYLLDKGGEFLSVLVSSFGISAVNGLREKKLVEEFNIHQRQMPASALKRTYAPVKHTKAQSAAVKEICNGSGVYLLHGVTGSGKTEVYESVIECMLEKGKSAIMLVPEISLTPQMLGIFRARFGDEVAILHSGLNASERYDEWKRLKTGEAKIAIGARSAIFAPLSNIGAIFIDEEHDTSYISENNPRYDTREVAQFRASVDGAVLVLGSATPDICTYAKATDGTFKLITLPDRISSYKLPDMELVDMTREFRYGNRTMFSATLTDAIGEALKRKEQIMLFINRRGFSSFLRCKECGYIPKCKGCDVSLTYHKGENKLKCHYCGASYAAITKCPNCGSLDLKQGRVGTEQVMYALKSLFPGVKCLRMDRDTTQHKDAYFEILDKFGKGEADILIGTQMIAKGHDFPNVTLVGIMEADAALFFSDYRASEKTFQLVTQVAGRAGRASKKGRVILQAYIPTHYVFKFAKTYDYEGFFKTELNRRMVTKFPPYSEVVRVLISSPDENDSEMTAREIYKKIKALQDEFGDFIHLHGAKSPITKAVGMTRYQVVMRLYPQNATKIIEKIYAITSEVKPNKGTVFVEINPQSLF